VIVLDTHAWIWWLSEPRLLSPKARRAVDAAVAADSVHISAISAWELAMLVERGRLQLDRTARAFIQGTEALPFVHFVDVDPRIALSAAELRWEHRDPADRLIAATAMLLGAPLLSKDERMGDVTKRVW
jgi:PIN domain nuclease of toxin-antitoxin system